ncbi:unnamed protein product [Cladocopium goreaui]|uniref:Hexosyltransferase n=1 Tax=Cladocopium goreaui TaxID=2562237 RepID=A0A9P1BNM8_9DINO|nr:unnamed protein product [Cladocopium goreaui]
MSYSRALLISLDERQDRRQRCQVLLTEIAAKLQWWPATRGQDLACEKLGPELLSNCHSQDPNLPRFGCLEGTSIWWNYDWLHMTPGAVGCALSHRAIWQNLLHEGGTSLTFRFRANRVPGAKGWGSSLILDEDFSRMSLHHSNECSSRALRQVVVNVADGPTPPGVCEACVSCWTRCRPDAVVSQVPPRDVPHLRQLLAVNESTELLQLAEHQETWVLLTEIAAKLQWWPATRGQDLACEKLGPELLSNCHSQDPNLPRFGCLEGTSIWWNYDWLHMTPGAVGCALSHRAIWQNLLHEGGAEDCWLVLEDDILWVSEDLDAKIHQVISKLPDGWHLCYLGWHGQSVLHLALGALGDVDCLEAAVELEDVSSVDHGPFGTFAYLIRRSGAQRLLQHTFPLHRQLDAQMAEVQKRGDLRAFRCADRSCLFYSAPCQLLDSDVQACWSADHDVQLRTLKLGFRQRQRFLNERVKHGHLPPLRLPSPQISLPDLGPARLLHPRCHVACVVVDSGSPDVPGLERQVWQLLQAARGVDWKILLLWFGHSSAVCREVATSLGLPLGSVFFQNLRNSLEAECPGAEKLVTEGSEQLVANLLTLPLLLGLCSEDLLLLSGNDAGAAQVLVDGNRVAQGLVAFRSEISEPQPPWLLAAFEDLRDDPSVSYLVPEEAMVSPPVELLQLFFRARSWAKMAPWMRELLRIALRLLELASSQLRTAISPVQAVSAATRCILGLSQVALELKDMPSWEVSAAGVSTRRSAQFEGYAEVARATQLGRFRCMDAVDWPLDVKGPLAAETSWLELSTGEPAGPHRWFWGCFGKVAPLSEWLQQQESLVGAMVDPSTETWAMEALVQPELEIFAEGVECKVFYIPKLLSQQDCQNLIALALQLQQPQSAAASTVPLPSQLLASLGVEDRLDVAPSATWLSAAPAALLWEAPGAALRRQGTSVKLTAWLTPPGEVVFPWLGSSDSTALNDSAQLAELDGVRLSAQQGDAMLVERGPEAGSRGSREAWHVQSSTTGTWTLQKVWQKWDQRLPEDVQIGIGGEKKHQKHQEKWGVRQVQLENL